MNQDQENLKMAIHAWMSAKYEVIEKNRYFPENLEMFYDLMDLLCKSSVLLVKPDTILYRARIVYDKTQLHNEAPFYGYDKELSFVPPRGSGNPGRSNPKSINYLYAASDEITAAMECRARLEDKISIAEIRCNSVLEIADLVYYNEIETIDEAFRFLLAREFSSPSSSEDDYIFSQFLSEYIKSLGYDGVRYNSAQNKSGSNFTIFNFDKCEAVASSVYEVKSICMSIKPISPIKRAQIKNRVSTLTKQGKASFNPTKY